LLVGHVPYNADTPFAIIHDHIYSPLPPPRSINPNLSEALEQVLLTCLAKKPHDRFLDINSMIKAFDAAIDGKKLPSAPGLEPQSPETLIFASLKTSDSPTKPLRSTPTVITKLDDSPSTPRVDIDVTHSTKKPNGKKWLVNWSVPIFILLIVFGTYLVRNPNGRVYFRTLRKNLPPQFSTQMAVVWPAQFANQNQQAGLTPVDTPLSFTPTPLAPTSPLEQVNTATPYATASPSPSATADLVAANTALNAALDAWANGDMPKAEKSLAVMRTAAGTDITFYQDAGKTLAAKGAWLLAAIMIIDPSNQRTPDMTIQQKNAQVHQLLFMAANDKLSQDYMNRNTPYSMFTIAVLRHQLYYGDMTKVKDQLVAVLSDPVQEKRFPEAHLLEAELAYELKEFPRAQLILQQLQNQTQLPQWVQNLALQFSNKFNSN